MQSLVATPCHCSYPLSALTFPQDPERSRLTLLSHGGWGRVTAAARQAPGPQHVWGEMGGSLRDAIQALSLAGGKPKKNMYL